MKGIIYYLAYSILWLLTLLPLSILYLLSGFLYAVLYYIARYRRKTVYTNLRLSLPDRSPAEISRISKAFFRQLVDYFMEWMYQINMGKKEHTRRMHFKNPEILEQYYKQKKSVIVLTSHYGNWEWTSLISCVSNHTALAVYKSLQNKYSDRLFLNLREKFGVIGVPMESTLRAIIDYQRKREPIILLTLGDQRPQWNSLQHWMQFLNQDTPVITGPEKIARKYNMPVLFLAVNKAKKGYYEVEFQVICEEPDETPFGEITWKYMKTLENLIKKRPELWLWSHKRWKYNRKDVKNPAEIGQTSS
ncbi:lysophospholipid acyltransferase family protein [Bacteroidota bacterium]